MASSDETRRRPQNGLENFILNNKFLSILPEPTVPDEKENSNQDVTEANSAEKFGQKFKGYDPSAFLAYVREQTKRNNFISKK